MDFDYLFLWQSLSKHLLAKSVTYVPVSSPPVLSPPEDTDTTGLDADLVCFSNLTGVMCYISGEG